MTKKPKLTVVQFLAEWARLHPQSKLNAQAKMGATIAGIIGGGRRPDVADNAVYDAVARACKTSRTKTEALRKANEELKSTRANELGLVRKHCNNADEMMRRRYKRAYENLNLPPYPHLAD